MNRSHTPVTISICTPDDPVKDFVIKQWEEFGFTYEPDEDQDLEDVQKYYMDQGGIFYVMKDTDQIIGTIGVRDRGGRVAELSRLYVDRNYQGKGYGSQLVDQVIEYCRSRNFARIVISTNKVFQKAHALYIKKGFKIVHEDHEDFTMEKVIIK